MERGEPPDTGGGADEAATRGLLRKWGRVPEPPGTSTRKLRVPIHVIAREALDVARFAERYWEPQAARPGDEALPGLRSAVCAGGQLEESAAADILELRRALAAAQERYRLALSAPSDPPVDRARELIAELRDVLDWYARNGGDEAIPVVLARLAEDRRTTRSQMALAISLDHYAALADKHVEHIDGLGGFDRATIDEARDIGSALREHRRRRIQDFTGKAPVALRLRNHIAHVLLDRMQIVRGAARFVFRKHPDVVRQVTSAYARQQRSAHRRRKGRDGRVGADA